MRLAAAVIAGDWALSNFFYYLWSDAAVNVIAPMNILVLGLFLTFWRAKSLNGAFIHKTFFFYYCLYLLVNFWHLLGRFAFPQTFAAQYNFSLAASNVIFILIVTTLWLFSSLKFVDNHAEGGLAGVFERNIGKWRKWFGGR